MFQEKTSFKGVYKDSKGRIFYQTELGTDAITGKRIRKKSYKDSKGVYFKNPTEANKELIRIKNEYYKTKKYYNYDMSIHTFMKETYIPYYKTTVKESTYEVRLNSFDLIYKEFPDKKLRDISSIDIINFRTWLLSSKEDGGAGYSQNYSALVFGTLKKILTQAKKLKFIDTDYFEDIKSIGKGKVITPYWNLREFEEVLSHIYKDDVYEHLYYAMFWVFFNTGARVNELTALYWEDLDETNAKLRINHMLVAKNKKDYQRNNYSKTDTSLRTITLDNDTIKVLKEWKLVQTELGLGKDNDFIFSYDGYPFMKSTISYAIKRYSKLAGVKRIQAKGFRHSHASYLINHLNVSVLVLSQRLGHSSPEITLKHYSHLWSGADKDIAEQMVGKIKPKEAKKSLVKFNGNQSILRKPTNNPTKNVVSP